MFEKLFKRKKKNENIEGIPENGEVSQDDQTDEDIFLEDPFGEDDIFSTEGEFDAEEMLTEQEEAPQQTSYEELDSFKEDQIEQLLAKEKEEGEGEGSEDLENPFEFAKSVEIYDTEERSSTPIQDKKEFAQIEKKIKEPNKLLTFFNTLPPKTLYKTIGVMSGILVILAIYTVVLFFINKGNNSENKTYLEIPNYNINSSSSIIVNEAKEFKGEAFSIKKLSINQLATTFYFDKNLDVETLEMTLVDDRNRIYAKDLTFIKYENERNEYSGSILTFKPLNEDVKSFYLSLYDTSTTEKVQYDFEMNDKIIYPPAIYVNDSVEVLSSTLSFSLKVDSATFSSSSSSVYYRLKWNGNTKMQLGSTSQEGGIKLTELGGPIGALADYPNQYFFEDSNTIIGRMDFKPIKKLTNKIKISFNNLCETFPINEEISAAPLFQNTEESQYTITKNNYTIVLERLGLHSGRYILVTHTKRNQPDTPIEPLDNAEDAQQVFSEESQEELINIESRAENQLDVDLVITNSSGQQAAIKGIVRSSEEGADIIFDHRDLDDSFKKVPRESLKLIVNNGNIMYPVITIPIDLKRESEVTSIDRTNLQAAVVNFYENKLREKAEDFSAQIETYSIEGEEATLIVNEIWKATDNIEAPYSHRKHKVTVRIDEVEVIQPETENEEELPDEEKEKIYEKKYTIIKDEIIEE